MLIIFFFYYPGFVIRKFNRKLFKIVQYLEGLIPANLNGFVVYDRFGEIIKLAITNIIIPTVFVRKITYTFYYAK